MIPMILRGRAIHNIASRGRYYVRALHRTSIMQHIQRIIVSTSCGTGASRKRRKWSLAILGEKFELFSAFYSVHIGGKTADVSGDSLLSKSSYS